MKIKMILIKQKQIQQRRHPLKSLNATKKQTKQTQGQKTESHAIILPPYPLGERGYGHSPQVLAAYYTKSVATYN